MKKPEAATAAEVRLADKGWLPEVLTNQETPEGYIYGSDDEDDEDNEEDEDDDKPSSDLIYDSEAQRDISLEKLAGRSPLDP